MEMRWAVEVFTISALGRMFKPWLHQSIYSPRLKPSALTEEGNHLLAALQPSCAHMCQRRSPSEARRCQPRAQAGSSGPGALKRSSWWFSAGFGCFHQTQPRRCRVESQDDAALFIDGARKCKQSGPRVGSAPSRLDRTDKKPFTDRVLFITPQICSPAFVFDFLFNQFKL